MGGSSRSSSRVEETETEKELARRSAGMWQSYYKHYAPVERSLLAEIDRSGSDAERERMLAGVNVDNIRASAVTADLSSPARALLAHQMNQGYLSEESGRAGVAHAERSGRAHVEGIAMGRDIEQGAHRMLARSASYAHRGEVSRAQAKQHERDALVSALGQAAGLAGGLYMDHRRRKEAEEARRRTREELGYPSGLGHY